jgi:hypothetical protein
LEMSRRDARAKNCDVHMLTMGRRASRRDTCPYMPMKGVGIVVFIDRIEVSFLFDIEVGSSWTRIVDRIEVCSLTEIEMESS